MKISKNELNYTAFENVVCGNVFYYKGAYYIKLAHLLYDSYQDYYNCVLLSDGDVSYIKENEMVALVNGEFKVY